MISRREFLKKAAQVAAVAIASPAIAHIIPKAFLEPIISDLDFYIGKTVIFEGEYKQSARITSYSNTTKVAAITELVEAPAAGDIFTIL